MPRMIRLAGQYINADRLYSIEQLPGTATVRIVYENAPNSIMNFDCNFTGFPDGEAKAEQWARDLAKTIDPVYISFNGELVPAQPETRDSQEAAPAEGQEEGGHSWV